MTDRIPLLLDVDTGIDDALALLYACASPEADVVAVTCIGGNVDARQVAANTLAVLDLAGRPDIPVYLGSEQPLKKALETSTETHGPRGLGYAELPPASRGLSEGHAADRIIELARSRPGDLILVTLGPLTNLALALEREPSLPRLLRGWVLMGCVFRGAGNTTPTSEWNIHVDPDAAKACFAAESRASAPARRPLAMGLEVTEQAADSAGGPPPSRRSRGGAAAGRGPTRAGAAGGRRERGREPGPAVRRRRPALLLRVPRDVRRLLRRVHP